MQLDLVFGPVAVVPCDGSDGQLHRLLGPLDRVRLLGRGIVPHGSGSCQQALRLQSPS